MGRTYEPDPSAIGRRYNLTLLHSDGWLRTLHWRAVFLSPHLDDAVFSCGGTIAKLQSEGPILVLNVFSGYPAEFRRGPVVIDERRHAEESGAARLLGFKSASLDECDAALREKAYQNPGNLFRPPVQRDMQRLPRLSARICDYLAQIHYDELYLPLGIGWHVDHVLCNLATQSLHRSEGVMFYEDAPYCLIPHFARYRLREFAVVDDADCRSVFTASGIFRDWCEASRYYATMAPIKKIGPWPMRLGAVAVVSLNLWQLLSRHRKLWPSAVGPQSHRLKPKVEDVSRSFLRKVDACYEYASQIGEFFTSRQDCELRYRGYSASIGSRSKKRVSDGDAFERFWAFEAAPTGTQE